MASALASQNPSYVPLRGLPQKANFKAGDVLVVFGELFSRGYANGLVDEAEKAGLKVVRSTVGRRDAEGKLRKLTDEELSAQPKPFINVPLEAGFDLEPASDGTSPVEQMRSAKLSTWNDVRLDWAKIAESRERGVARFRKNVSEYMTELKAHIPKGANVIFLHTMAGGVPRAKIIMPLMNRVFKGVGDRHMPSSEFWNSELGQVCSQNFDEVTAGTFEHLLDLSSELRMQIEKNGGTVRYQAFGYHGTEVLIRGEYTWQSYAPYIQGWAKKKLEALAMDAWEKGLHATVFNCPEILTNSSSIFVGVEVPLYPFLAALKKEAGDGTHSAKVKSTFERCARLLKPEHNFDEIQKFTDKILSAKEIQAHCEFASWPQHNGQEQMETLIGASEHLVEMHKDEKNLITFVLSEEIFRATGYVMFHDSFHPQAPVLWLGHDVLAKALATDRTL